MMSSTKRCRLCVKICQESKNLYDENGSGNSLYDITVNYFHPKIININLAKHLNGICLECWQHISDFQSYQTSVMLAQKYLEISDELGKTIDDDRKGFNTTQLVIKKEAVDSEEEDNSVQSYSSSTKSLQVSKPCENSTTNDSGQILLPKLEIRDIKCDNSNDDDDSMSSQSEFLSDTEEESLLYDTAAASANKTDNLEIPSSIEDLNVLKFVKEIRRKYCEVNMDELVAKHIPIIECNQCSETFKVFSSFNDHFVQRHPNVEAYFTCFCSAKKWNINDYTKYTIKDHFLVHEYPDFFKCLICGSNKYKYKRSLHYHITSEHRGGMKHFCKLCGQCFTNKTGLNMHNNTVHKDNRDNSMKAIKTDSGTKFACNECDKILLSHISMRRHIESMHKNKAGKLFKCEVCEKIFKFPRSLREHATSHTMKDLYACAFCKETFKRMTIVLRHRNEVHPLEQDKAFYHHIK